MVLGSGGCSHSVHSAHSLGPTRVLQSEALGLPGEAALLDGLFYSSKRVCFFGAGNVFPRACSDVHQKGPLHYAQSTIRLRGKHGDWQDPVSQDLMASVQDMALCTGRWSEVRCLLDT